MSRFQVQGVNGAGVQQVASPDPNNAKRSFSFSVQNVGTTNVWIADSQTNLLSSVQAGTPNYGFVLAPGSAPFNDPAWVGPAFALTAGPQGLLEVKASYQQC
jgi:hypothetical protein